MSGDPFKIVHDQKASRRQDTMKQAQKTTRESMMGVEEKKRKLQPTEGQVFDFKDEK